MTHPRSCASAACVGIHRDPQTGQFIVYDTKLGFEASPHLAYTEGQWADLVRRIKFTDSEVDEISLQVPEGMWEWSLYPGGRLVFGPEEIEKFYEDVINGVHDVPSVWSPLDRGAGPARG